MIKEMRNIMNPSIQKYELINQSFIRTETPVTEESYYRLQLNIYSYKHILGVSESLCNI